MVHGGLPSHTGGEVEVRHVATEVPRAELVKSHLIVGVLKSNVCVEGFRPPLRTQIE